MPRFPVAAITDEFSSDPETAARAMASLGMTGAELRTISGRNIIDLTDPEVDRVAAIFGAHGLAIVSIASPVFKCVLPDAGEVDTRFRQDVFAAQHTFADQPRLARRAFEIAARTGAPIVRVFTFWRTVQPEACFERVATALAGLAELAAQAGVIVGIENEHACNIGTASETARLLASVPHPNLQLVWDPANALVAGETPFPDGYAKLPASRIAHVHAKDCRISGRVPEWVELGTGSIDWTGQIDALVRDSYRGWFSLETHWRAPAGDKLEASTICGRNLTRMVEHESAGDSKQSPHIVAGVWPTMIAEHADEVGRFKRVLDSAFSGGATSSDRPEDRVVFPLLVCCRDIVEEILFALSAGFGRAALRAVRTMYECVVVARFLHLHPEKADEFLDSFHVQWAKVLQNIGAKDRPVEFDREVRAHVPKYAQGVRVVLRDLDWSGKKTLEMAKEAGRLADLHPWAFDLASAYIHPSSVLFMSELTPGSTEESPQIGESKQEEEGKFAIKLAYDIILNAVDLRLEYAPSDGLRLLLDECKADFSRIWGDGPHV